MSSGGDAMPNRQAGDKNGPSWDMDIALRNTGGDRQLLGELVQIFLEDSPLRMSEIRCAVEQDDRPALTRAAHTLKGSSFVFGAIPVTDLAAQIEECGRNGNMTAASALSVELGKQLEALRRELAAVPQPSGE